MHHARYWSALMLCLLFAAGAASASEVETLREQARAAAAAGDAVTAMERYRRLLEQVPEDGAAHYRLGILLMDNGGDPDRAEAHFERAAELGFQPLGAAYRLSRLFARTGREDQALAQLEIVAAGGFGLVQLIEGEADYASLRDHPRFQAALATIRASRYPCQADERHHAFDFWIGEWIVSQNGQFAGTNSIQPILGHCALFEQWTSASGGLGKSFNYYDPAHDHWRQIWISDSRSIIEFTGTARDGGLYYTAETTNPADGSVTRHKFEFTQNDDGTVRQFWQTSSDGGATWSTIWDAVYTRREETADP